MVRTTRLGLIAGLAVAGTAMLADAAREHEGLSRLDPLTAREVLLWRTPALTQMANALTFLGSELVVGGLTIAVLCLLITRRSLTQAAVFAIGMGGSVLLTVVVKHLVARPRPGAVDRLGALDTSYSFPSGHTLNSAVFLALVVWLLWPTRGYAGRVAMVVAGVVLGVGVAASRVYLGYHWLTDVLASDLVAIAWLTVVGLAGIVIAKVFLARADGR